MRKAAVPRAGGLSTTAGNTVGAKSRVSIAFQTLESTRERRM